MLGVSRTQCVPNLTWRFGASLPTDAGVREQLRCLEEKLDGSGPPERTFGISPLARLVAQ
jgi:hypothetical protein